MLSYVLIALDLVLMAAGFFLGAKQRSLAHKITIFVVTLAIGIPTLFVLTYMSTYGVLYSFIENIAEAFNIPSELTVALATLLIIPATWAAGLSLSFSKRRRSLGTAVLVVGIAAYWALLWLGTRDQLVTAEGERLRCYTITQDGVRFFERQQIDPRTGEECRWVDQTNIRFIQAIDRKLRSGEPLKQLHFNSREEARFFATGTNGPVPLVWYYRTTDGDLEFFDAPGVHPTFGIALKPVTPDVAEEWVRTHVFTPETSEEAASENPSIPPSPSLIAPVGKWSEPMITPAHLCYSFWGVDPKGDRYEVAYYDVDGNFRLKERGTRPTSRAVMFRSKTGNDEIVYYHFYERQNGRCRWE